MSASHVTKNGEIYYLRFRVPRRYAQVENRREIRISLHTDSKKLAKRKADEIYEKMVFAWEAKLAGLAVESENWLVGARNLAANRGYQYLDVDQVAWLPLDDLLKRVSASFDTNGHIRREEALALVGLAQPGTIRIGDVIEHFYQVSADRLIGKSDDQLKRHKYPRHRAVNNFLQSVGDLTLADITTNDLFRFREWWLMRVVSGAVKASTANKDFVYLVAMIRAVARAKSIKLQFTTEGLYLRSQISRSRVRPPFSDDWIRTKILADGAFAKLDTEARIILLGMINTGYRPSEGAALLPKRIRLYGDIPFIEIRPDLRTLKNIHSERDIPLTGISLEAFRQHSTGFPTYADNPQLSHILNSYLRDSKLLETPEHSLYGFRHAFEDRMLEAGMDERVRRDLLGHRLDRERYGKGGGMKFIHSLMNTFAL